MSRWGTPGRLVLVHERLCSCRKYRSRVKQSPALAQRLAPLLLKGVQRQTPYKRDVPCRHKHSSVAVRFEALDALRGVCALLVVLFHIPIYHALKDVGAFANLQFCVDMFFALSGFVLCHAYGQRLNDGR